MLTIEERKRQIRQQLLSRLNAHKEGERQRKSASIARQLFSLKEYIKAKTVLFYLSFDGEVDTHAMIAQTIAQGKNVAVPHVRRETREIVPSLLKDPAVELTRGPHGTQHPKEEFIRPVPMASLGLVVVPGLAFDEAGNRLGRGLGYYDRFLERLPQDIPTVGLAFGFQRLRNFPPLEPHDITVTKTLFA
jgi:5-formyltetrahydrofolate cyclo-ligase